MTKARTGNHGPAGSGADRPRPADSCVMVIFGGTGDLTKRKLVPALYNLHDEGLLPERFAVIGFGTSDIDDEGFRRHLAKNAREFIPGDVDDEAFKALLGRVSWVQGDFRDGAAFKRLARRIAEVDEAAQTGGNVLFYFAAPPSFFGDIVAHLGKAGLVGEDGDAWRRVVIEKPFGRDLATAQELDATLRRQLREDQVYRIDHYLGKETVQNLMVFRFANGLFEPIWNHNYVDHVQITVAEDLGVEHRAGYYESAGALRDMVPNHLFQLLALTAMEPPVSFDADAVREEKVKTLRAIQPLTPEEVLSRTVRGQYGPGVLADGTEVGAYREEDGVADHSRTETFVAMKLMIDNWRWAGVPFYLRTGKRMPRRLTEIAIQFKRAPFIMFSDTPVEKLPRNFLVIRIQPEESIALRFGAKVPGPTLRIDGVDMDFCYEDFFGSRPSTGYETLLYDAMNGDATLFQRADQVETAWRVLTPILDVWQALEPRDFPNYPAGGPGPEAAADLIRGDGRDWRSIG